jgi:hypothetical protein
MFVGKQNEVRITVEMLGHPARNKVEEMIE